MHLFYQCSAQSLAQRELVERNISGQYREVLLSYQSAIYLDSVHELPVHCADMTVASELHVDLIFIVSRI